MTNVQGEYLAENLNWGKYLVVTSYADVLFENGVEVKLSAENKSAENTDFLIELATSVDSPKALTKLHVYPNPAQDMLWVKGVNETINYKICTIDGNCVKTGETNALINTGELKTGVFILILETSSIKQIIKIIKQ